MLQQPSFLELVSCSHVKRGPMKRVVAQRHLSQEPGKRVALKIQYFLRIAVPVSSISTVDTSQLLGLLALPNIQHLQLHPSPATRG